ncbi:hypothetical protein AVEN_34378-1 [Araneus ventricosus]|uniref:Mutator-like transposase domain-containing protein n=1 Tax=Araneus ventricosus TaxID=182803 RepID=A0A4Y2G3U2_ARAVE|nr:hypothetical protein AVEN_34378-1 [Araneus ventricosus]
MPKYRTKRTKNLSFHGNRFTNANQSVEEPATASASKLIMNDYAELKDEIGRKSTLNSLLVLGLRLIGKGFTAGKKLLCTVNLRFMSKSTFRRHEDQLLKAVRCAADKNMKEAATEVRAKKRHQLVVYR